ncbi:MAG TPA: SDR family NAD(P)-dependent oxidoreductase [Bacillota bacterium]|nr:SDR family NAD(P)-dependent oxidoreductase [Bacillota bacterium]
MKSLLLQHGCAVITGGTGGIGEECVKLFAESGFKTVFIWNGSADAAKRISEQTGAEALQCDITDAGVVKETVAYIASCYGSISVLVNCAGVSLTAPFNCCTEQQTQKLYSVNLGGTLNCCRAAAPYMVREKHGSIVNVSSVWGLHGASCEVDYSCSKGAVIALTKALSRELGPSGVRVNCVCPGLIDTKMNAALTKDDVDAFCTSLSLGRPGMPAEAAKAIMFLASEDASYITGAVLAVDGGF